MQMIANGVQVRVVSGRPLREAYVHARPGRFTGLNGILHAKVLWTESVAMIGSCNFTTSSQANREIVAVIRPSSRGVGQLKEAFGEIWDAAVPYADAVVEAAGSRREAARGSQSPSPEPA